MLCSNYNPKLLQSATTWYVSEKFDGWRLIRKNGKFIGRSGKVIAVPDYIKEAVVHIPNHIDLDGELWLGYDKFQDISTALDAKKAGFQWLLFDVITAQGGYEERLHILRDLIGNGNSVVQIVPQMCVKSEKEIDDVYGELLKNNPHAEGIVLRPSSMEYLWNVRDDMFMKRKPVQDIEVRVVGYHTTQAKKGTDGYVSSVVCQYMDDVDRMFHVAVKTTSPPPLGSIITVAYQNMTQAGIPRFPRFKGIRSEGDMPHVVANIKPSSFTLTTIPKGTIAYTIEEIKAMEMPLDVKPGKKVYICAGTSGYHCVTKPWNPDTKPYCTCPAWKWQRKPPTQRTCKHTLAVFPELETA